jgi:hypothetical protein
MDVLLEDLERILRDVQSIRSRIAEHERPRHGAET